MQNRPLKNSSVIIREDEGKILALNQEQQLLLVMNSSGFFIWDQCDGYHSIEDISEAIRQSYDVAKTGLDEPGVSEYVRRFLNVLEKGKLISFASEEARSEFSNVEH
jgi:hypothetical protein